MADWLGEHGPTYGWGPCGPATAQLMASRGNPCVAVWKNPEGTGHIAMVLPGAHHPEKGPCIAQAGRVNFRSGHVRDGFGAGRAVEYLVHMQPPTAADLKDGFERLLLSPIGSGKAIMEEARRLLEKYKTGEQ